MEQEVYQKAILTFAFTNDGRIITRRDKEGNLDTLPLLFMGYCEGNSKTDYDESVWVMNHLDDYKNKIANFFLYHLKNARSCFLNNFFTGKGDYLLDVGTLYEKISRYQVEEMKNLPTPSYIRISNELYKGSDHMLRQIETRYIVLSQDEDIENFPELDALEFSSLTEDSALSPSLMLGITGENGYHMQSFVRQLKSFSNDFSSGGK